MLSGKNKLVVISILDSVLGVGSSLKHNEQVHLCPFCHHHKPKLQVNLDTQKWHCWVCNAKGKRIKSLLNRLNTDVRDIQRIVGIYGDEDTNVSTEEIEVKLYLPKEFKQLYFKPKSINPTYNQAIFYLKGRGITMSDIVKYNIGYCETGIYGGRIIIPSYDENGELNYFIARSFYDGAVSTCFTTILSWSGVHRTCFVLQRVCFCAAFICLGYLMFRYTLLAMKCLPSGSTSPIGMIDFSIKYFLWEQWHFLQHNFFFFELCNKERAYF